MVPIGITKSVSSGGSVVRLNVYGLHLNLRFAERKSLHPKISHITTCALVNLFGGLWNTRVYLCKDGKMNRSQQLSHHLPAVGSSSP